MLPRPHVRHQMSQEEKNVQPVCDSNPGPLAYRASALPTELTGPLTHYNSTCVQVHTVTYTPCELEIPVPEFQDSSAKEAHKYTLRAPLDWPSNAAMVPRVCAKCHRERKCAVSPGLEHGTPRLQGECCPDWAKRAAYTLFLQLRTRPDHDIYPCKLEIHPRTSGLQGPRL